MKILYLITKSNWGGAQKYVYDLATAAQARGLEVAVAAGGEGELLTKLKEVKIKIIALPQVKRDIQFLGEFGNLLKLIKLLKQERPDIIHLNSSKIGGLGALAGRLAGVPKIIFTIHGWPFNEQKNILWRLIAWAGSYLTAILSTLIIVLAEAELKQAKQMPSVGHKTVLIRNGIDELNFLPREEARQQLNLPLNAIIIGSIGELTGNKNHSQLAQAAIKLKGQYPKLELVVIGEGEDRVKLADSQINLLGHKTNAYKYLLAFDIFVLPSLKEGLPYVLLEAGAASLPVVATKVGGIPEIIENEVSGLLVPKENAEALAEAIIKLLTKKVLAESYGQKLHQTIATKFSKQKMLDQTFALYKN